MIGRIARNEVIRIVRDGRLRCAAAVLVVLLALSAWVGREHQQTLARERAAATEQERTLFVGQGDKNPHSAAHYGTYAFRTVPALAMFDPGLLSVLGTAQYLEAHRRNFLVGAVAADSPVLQRFGELSAGYVLAVLVPLLIFLLAYGAFAEERENGTLALVLAQGVVPWKLIVGKAIALLAILGAIAGPAFVLLAIGVVVEDWRGLGRLGLLAGLYVSFFAVLAAFALAISASARSARSALATLLVGWVVLFVVGPRVAVMVADRLRPAPDLGTFETNLRAERSAMRVPGGEWERREKAAEQELLASRGAKGFGELPVNPAGFAMDLDEVLARELYGKHFAALFATQRSHERMLAMAAALFPVLAVRSLSAAICGTDLESHRHFHESADAYRFDVVRAMNMAMFENRDPSFEVGASFYESVPRFEYRGLPLASVLTPRWPEFVVLGVLMLLGVLVTRRCALRLTGELA